MKAFIPSSVRILLCQLFQLLYKHSPVFFKKKLSRLPFSRFRKITLYLFEGQKIINYYGAIVKVNPGEVSGYYAYLLGFYSNQEVEKIIEICRQAKVFVDVGANIGLFFFALAKRCPNLEVFSFEPDPYLAKKFLENRILNKDLSKRIHFIEKAVSNQKGSLFFRRSLNPWHKEDGRITDEKTPLSVPSLRLDSFFKKEEKYPDVVKIDAEGAEYQVLAGMEGLFAEGYPKFIMVEVHSFYHEDSLRHKEDVKGILKKNGYKLHQLKGKKWQSLDSPEKWPGRCHIMAVKKKNVQ